MVENLKSTGKSPNSFISRIRAVLALAFGLLWGAPAMPSPIVPVPPATHIPTLQERLIVVRKRISELEQSTPIKKTLTDDLRFVALQWGNFNNWNNWANFRNFNNWGNFGNWRNY
ncbi:hypothetical protein [Tunturiibacter gelidiferens]|uniref:Uncharacterized protein n=1 Tax=Tunturiibacter gelidiferens TaxID=3069689 RepID=A0AAU7YXD8_9BACT